MKEKNSTLVRDECWFPETANIWLKDWMLKNTSKNKRLKVFEFGCGSSTIYLSKFENVHITSVEHDTTWYFKVRDALVEAEAVTLVLSDRPYSAIILPFPDEYFDLVIVDGRDRVKCLKNSFDKVKQGGVLILDNSERGEYEKGVELYKNWHQIHFTQPNEDKYGFTYDGWKTTVFIKPLQNT